KSGCINSPDVHLKQQTETKQTGVVTRQSATKRRYSNSSPTKRLSAESNSTQGSCNSQSTTSSAYSEISPPVKRIPDVVMNDETIQTRCRIGIDSRGGMGYQPSPRESHPQKFVQTGAFLDSGSDASLVAEYLARQVQLEVSSLESLTQVTVLKAWTVKELHQLRGVVLTIDQISLWSQLQHGVVLPDMKNEEIMVLICFSVL
ncbi:unnamed protein product, partial [Trichobilharzia regenti]